MAKINVEFDTVSKAMKITMDGKELKNVERICGYKWSIGDNGEEMFAMDIESFEQDKDNKTWTTTRVSANKKGEAKVESMPISQHISAQLFGSK